MAFADKNLQCICCGTYFTFKAEEQEFFKSKGYTEEPKRCLPCRRARRLEYHSDGGNGYRSQRPVFPIFCARCGKKTHVPFEPQEGRQVYCRECYKRGPLKR